MPTIAVAANKPMLAAADRRAQFQLNKTITVNNERKLVRAMSAPIRPIVDDNNLSKIQQGKRRVLRRKKNYGRDRFGADADCAAAAAALQTHLFFEGDEDDDIVLSAASVKGKSLGATKCGVTGPLNCNNQLQQQQQNRSRTVLNGCDVVTLVSLLSSGGSDSEREDVSTSTKNGETIVAAIGGTGGKAPMLGKSGKSGKY